MELEGFETVKTNMVLTFMSLDKASPVISAVPLPHGDMLSSNNRENSYRQMRQSAFKGSIFL
eukprot:6178447-Pleurochrysis_carterae.AAC.1